MIICIDLDGVVVRYDFHRLAKQYFGVKLPEDEIFAYDLADVLGVSPDEINDMFKEQVWGKPKFIEGAVETMRGWLNKYVIGILSNRTKYMNIEGLIQWMEHYKIPFSFVVTKLKTYPFAYHIDDSPSKLMKVNAENKILFNQPWNKRCLNIKNGMIRVNNWQEIREIIK